VKNSPVPRRAEANKKSNTLGKLRNVYYSLNICGLKISNNTTGKRDNIQGGPQKSSPPSVLHFNYDVTSGMPQNDQTCAAVY
jgi:hypothetical protein